MVQLMAPGRRVNTSLKYAKGSIPRRRQHSMSVYMTVLRFPARASPMNNQLERARVSEAGRKADASHLVTFGAVVQWLACSRHPCRPIRNRNELRDFRKPSA